MGFSVSPPPAGEADFVKIETKTLAAAATTTFNSSLASTYTRYLIKMTGIWAGVAAPGINLSLNGEAQFLQQATANASTLVSSVDIEIYNVAGIVHVCRSSFGNNSTNVISTATRLSTIDADITSILVNLDNTVAGTFTGTAILYGIK